LRRDQRLVGLGWRLARIGHLCSATVIPGGTGRMCVDAGEVGLVPGRIGGHRFERSVGPPGPAPADPEVIRMDGGC
jgi:hypothetical protein